MDVTVTVTDTITVHPSPPIPADEVLALSHLDNDPNLRTTIRYLRLYSPATTVAADHPFNVIPSSLSKALAHYYPLAGTLRKRPFSGRLELFCSPGRGVRVVLARVDKSLAELGYFADVEDGYGVMDLLAPDRGEEEGLENPCVLQVTVFGCGGLCLGAAIHHALSDGIGATGFFTLVGAIVRGKNEVGVELVWDRARLLGPREPPRVEVPFGELLMVGEGSSVYGGDGEVERVWFDVKDEWLDRFKKRLSEESGGGQFTTFEVLAAFIWRAKVKASGVPSDENVKFVCSMNIRKTVKPALPPGFWGNGCVPIYVQLTAKYLLEQPMWMTADLIKKSKSQASDEYVRSYVDFQELNYDKGITAGKWVSAFTDWRHLGHSAVDFGWGGPVVVFPLSRNLLGSTEPCFFLPYSSARQGDADGFKVLVNLRQTAVPSFREEMAQLSSIGLGSSSSL